MAWQLGNRNQDLFTAVMPVSARAQETERPWAIPENAIHSRDDGLIPIELVTRYVETQAGTGAAIELTEVSGIAHYETAAFREPLREALVWLRAVWR